MRFSFLQYEFQKKHFGFSDAEPKDFYCSTWFRQRSFFVAYRAIIFTYCLVWAVTNRVYFDTHYSDTIAVSYLTSWAEWLQTVNFGISFLVAVYGLIRSHENSSTFSENAACCPNNKCNQGDLRWFHQLQWVLSSTSTAIQFTVTVMFWSFSKIGLFDKSIMIHQHAINSVLAAIDIFMSRIPIRLLHFIYVSAFALFYVILTLILHGAGVKSMFYEGMLDWDSYPGRSAGVCIGVILVGCPLFQSVSFLLYHVRQYLSKKLLPTEKVEVGNNSNESKHDETDAKLFDEEAFNDKV